MIDKYWFFKLENQMQKFLLIIMFFYLKWTKLMNFFQKHIQAVVTINRCSRIIPKLMTWLF